MTRALATLPPAQMPATPSKRKREGAGADRTQPSLFSYLESPSKRRDATAAPAEPAEFPAELLAEADENAQIEADRRLAEELQRQWADEERGPEPESSTQPAAPQEPPAGDMQQEVTVQAPPPTRPEPPPAAQPPAQRSDPVRLDKTIAEIPLDEDLFVFQPAAVDTSDWPIDPQRQDQRRTPYALLASAFARASAVRSRLQVQRILTNALRIVRHHDPDSVAATVYLMSGQIAPPYEGVELGLGGSSINRIIAQVSGRPASTLRKLWHQSGDAGDVAFEACKNMTQLVRREPLTVPKVFATLHSIARTAGQRSLQTKQGLAAGMLSASRGEERRYLVRTWSANLRIHAVRLTILIALARAFSLAEDLESTDAASCIIGTGDRRGVIADTAPGKARNDTQRLALLAKLGRAESAVRQAYARHPNMDDIARALLDHGIDHLSTNVTLAVGTPITPMLGSITRSLDTVFDKMGERAFVSEFKYDGQRVQLHAEKDGAGFRVRIFSRHLEDITEKYPDIVAMVPQAMAHANVGSFIMDAEVVAVSATGELLPFQMLANRARKQVNTEDIRVQVCVFAFDLMFLDGRALLESPLRERRRLYQEHFPPHLPGSTSVAGFGFVQACESRDAEQVSAFFHAARNSRCEGIMVKTLDHVAGSLPEAAKGEALGASAKAPVAEASTEQDRDADAEDDADDADTPPLSARGQLLSTYEPDRRTEAWLKVKKDYVEGIGDSLDLVPIGAWHGMGRKAAFWSPILLAVYDAETGMYQALCKCMSGFSDAFYEELNSRFGSARVQEQDPATLESVPLELYDTGGLIPDVWWPPREVWEIRGAELTFSPVYTAAMGTVMPERGFSLRFPRFMRRRDDRSPETASGPEVLLQMYAAQGGGQKDDGEVI